MLKSGNLLHKRGLDDSQLHTTVVVYFLFVCNQGWMLLTDAVMLFHGIFAHLHLGIVHKLRTSLHLMFVVMAEKPTKQDFCKD